MRASERTWSILASSWSGMAEEERELTHHTTTSTVCSPSPRVVDDVTDSAT